MGVFQCARYEVIVLPSTDIQLVDRIPHTAYLQHVVIQHLGLWGIFGESFQMLDYFLS